MSNTHCIQAENGLEHKGRVRGWIDRRWVHTKSSFQPFIWKLRRQGGLLGLVPEKQESWLARYGYLLMTQQDR